MTLQNEILPWQRSAWAHLCQYFTQHRLPQALLITGQKGLGKQQLADQFALSLLCSKPQPDFLSCGRCDSCLLFAAQTHPDYNVVKPDEPGKAITIGQIRNLVTRLTLKPQFEAHRVVIINPAEQMNNAAANAFLKCLEEPTERTIIILITDKPTRLPATIVSRCQKLAVERPERDVHNAWLRQQNIHDNLELLYDLSQGAPLLSQSYASEKILMLRNQCFNAWMAVAKQQTHPVMVAEDWIKLPESSLLFWITSWIVDLIKCCYHTQAGKLSNPDLYEHLKELSQQLELKGIYKLYDLLLISRQRLDTQINKLSMFEEILIQWFELNQRQNTWPT
jgi:DNA polymerase-3 subunit delta'